MATSIDERILDLIVTKLATITTGNGYEQTVSSANIWRATSSPQPMESTPPSLEVRHVDTAMEPHLRGAIECLMNVVIICSAAYDAADEAISDLVGDVVKLVLANKRWNDGSVNLAVRTWMGSPEIHETETGGGVGGDSPTTGAVPFTILFRVDATNPFAIKEI